MARYTGPRDKVSRRFGVALFGPSKALERRPFPPGQHGQRAGRKKRSDYGVMLAEKQKLRFQYGVLEKQFRAYYEEAARRTGVTGTILLQLLETRLDNICYRAGLANSRAAARQLVAHGHVQVNGVTSNAPSQQCRPGDKLSVVKKDSSQALAKRNLETTQAVVVPDWLVVDKEGLTIGVTRIPERDEIDPIVNEQLIVEFYSR